MLFFSVTNWCCRQYLAVFCSLLLLLLCSDIDAKNLLNNPTFDVSDVYKEGASPTNHRRAPVSWHYDGWNLNAEHSYFTIEESLLDTKNNNSNRNKNKKNLRIHHEAPGHSYLWQAFELQKNTQYRLTAKVKVMNADSSIISAALGVVGQRGPASSRASHHSWRTLNYYINNASESRSVKLMLSFGFYSNLNKGEVVFSDVSMSEVTSIPENLKPGSAKLVYGKPKSKISKYYLLPPKNSVILFSLLISIGCLIFFVAFVLFFNCRKVKD